MEQTEAQEPEKKPEKPPEKPKTDEERYNEIQAKPEHKRTMKEKEFVVRFEANREEVRHHLSLVTKVSEKATTFGNAEKGRIRRRITDKVKSIGPEDHIILTKLQQDRKTELKELDRWAKKVAKRIETMFAGRRAKVLKEWDARIAEARAGTQERYKECEQELNDALAEVGQQIDAFLELIPEMTDDQLQALLEGKAVEIEIDGVKDTVVLPGT